MEKTAVQKPRRDATQKPKREKIVLAPTENLAHIAIAAQTISNVVDTILRSAEAKHRVADWALLQKLSAREAPQPMGRLALHLGVTRQRIQKQIDALAEAKLVDVQVTEDDKRGRNITLTRQGREALAAIDALWAANLSGGELVAKAANLDGVRRRLERVSVLLGGIGRAHLKEARVTKTAAKAMAGSGKK